MNNDDFCDNYYINEVDEPVTTRHSRNNTTAFKSYKKETPAYKESIKALDESINNLLTTDLWGNKKKYPKVKRYKALGFLNQTEYFGWLQNNNFSKYHYDLELLNSYSEESEEISKILSRYNLN